MNRLASLIPVRRYLRWQVRGSARVRTLDGSAHCEVIDVSIGGVLIASASRVLRRRARACIELDLPGLARVVAYGTLVPRNAVASVVMFESVSPAMEDAIAALGYLVRDEREHPRVLVAAPEPSCAQIVREVRSRGAIPLDAHTPLEAVRRLNEPVTDATAALISQDLTQTCGDELASFVEIAYPTTRIAMVDHALRDNPEEMRQCIDDILKQPSRA